MFEGQQAVLVKLHMLCKANHLTINTKQSAVVVSQGHKCSNRPSRPIGYAGTPLPARTFKGIPPFQLRTQPMQSMRHGHCTKATAAMHAQRCHEMGVHDVRLRYNLFRYLVMPVIGYGCEVWAVWRKTAPEVLAASCEGKASTNCSDYDALQVPNPRAYHDDEIVASLDARLGAADGWMVEWYGG
jgi:hypothetical protein